MGGSFVGSTADAIRFGEDNFFSASNPDSSSLLKVNPSALFFNQVKAASIESKSVADSGRNSSDTLSARGLRVPDGKSLLLVGGDININGGGLYAFGGRVELGGLAGKGTVGLDGDENNLSLSFPDAVDRSNVFLSNGAVVDVIAGNGGSIAVNARNLEMIGKSKLLAGIESGLGSDDAKAGDIDFNVTGALNLQNNSSIANMVLPEAKGKGGNVNINANTLQIEDGASVRVGTFGAGKGGNLTVNAQDVQLKGEFSGLFSLTDVDSAGDGGNLTIQTNKLLVQDGAAVGAGTGGAGKGGNLTINAQDVQLKGEFGGLFSLTDVDSAGDGGNLTIQTNKLLIQDRTAVGAGTGGAGKGGNLTVKAQDIQLKGESSGLFSQTDIDSTGDGGNLTIQTSKLLVESGAQASAGTFGTGKGGNLTVKAQDVQLIGTSKDGLFASGLYSQARYGSKGDAGDLSIETNKLLVQDGAQIGAGTSGEGKGANLAVDAQEVQLIGKSKDGQFASGLYAGAESNSSGDAGNLSIETSKLLVQDGAQVGFDTFGARKGRSLIEITADNTLPNNSQVKVEGNVSIIEGGTTAGNNLFHSFEKFGVPTGSEAHFNNAIDISNIIARVTGKWISNVDGLIKANGEANLFLINPNGIVFSENARLDIGSSFIASTADSLKFADGNEFSATNAVNKPLLSNNFLGLQYGNNPGSIVNKSQVAGDNKEKIGLQVKPGNSLALIGGDIELDGGNLTAVEGKIELGSVAGNNLVRLNQISKGWDFEYEGIEEFKDIHMSRRAAIDTSGSGNGEIEIQAKEITLAHESKIWAYTLGNKDGKNVLINALDLIVKDGSQIAVSSNAEGNGGSLKINASESIKVIGTANNSLPSGLTAQSYGDGSSGNITINTKELIVQDGGQIVTSTYSLEDKLYGNKTAGDLKIFASDSVKVVGKTSFPSAISTETFGFGNAGDITIKAPQLIIEDGAYISTSSRFLGMGGNLNISSDLIQIKDSLSGLFTESTFLGNAGSLNIDTKHLLVNNGARISSSFMNSFAFALVNVSQNSKAITYSHIIIPMFLEDNYGASAAISSHTFRAVDCLICDKPDVSTFSYASNYLNNEENFKEVFKDRVDYESVFINNTNAGDININASEKIEISGT
ncbi:MAG: filamentous hemagglutinin N-terminal domain-containing protein, partial [Cyanobacteria bacterium J06641_2]